MQVDEYPDQGVDTALDDRTAAERFEFGAPAHHLPGNEFDNLERRAQHRVVLAQRDRARHRNRCVSQRGDHPVLAGHVVRRRCQPVQGRTAHQPARRVIIDPEGQIGASTGDQLATQLAVAPDPQRTQIPVQRAQIEPVESVNRSHRTCLPLAQCPALAQAAFDSAPSGTAELRRHDVEGRIGPVEDAQECLQHRPVAEHLETR